jgi:hypothetical protein
MGRVRLRSLFVGSDLLAAAGSESAAGQREMCLYNPSFALLRLFWQLAHKHVCCDWSADLLSYNRVLDVCSGKVCPFSGDVEKAKAGVEDVRDRGSGFLTSETMGLVRFISMIPLTPTPHAHAVHRISWWR